MFGTPYVPGMARGILQHGEKAGPGPFIEIITQNNIDSIQSLPAGFIVVDGAPFSHSMIRVLGMGVPVVIVSQQQAASLDEGQEIIIDGLRGHISTDMSLIGKEALTKPAAKAAQPCLTADGEEVQLLASVRSRDNARLAKHNGAKAIGLVRSEFFTPDHGQVPDTEYYQRVIGELCQAASPLTVTFRLLDVSADKMPTWLAPPGSSGGVLCMQGARLFGQPEVQEVINAQLTAISQLSTRYKLRVLIPYLVRYEECCYWVEYLRRTLPESIPIGAMAETPASTLDISHWFDCVDFMAIGCNDLMQCLFAADRDQAILRDYLDPYAPLLFRYFRLIAEQAGQHLPQIQLCGVLPQLPGILPVLLGLGYRTFSVEASLIPYLAQNVSTININAARELANRICAATTSRQVLEKLKLPDEYHRTFLSPE
jgi:phosphoenolpyruvate-protein kinase (PTS system EI component)